MVAESQVTYLLNNVESSSYDDFKSIFLLKNLNSEFERNPLKS